jgi:serine/threonine protein kinase/Flp pilus assembly protein TadD
MAIEAATEMLADDRAIVGKQIGRYQVLSLIGRGGMGEVFLAQDASLGRKVALKLLRSDFTTNEDRLRRFQQEARAASALNHPNILTIHEIGQDDSLHFMATEYVEGDTLRQHITRAPMALGQALDVAVQVASALSAAHHAGIVHRDIKPENIMLRSDGYAKVLDFGLAKLVEPKAIDTVAPTLLKFETEPGLVMGTVSYMSPEQARGLAVDARTDIWSLGVMIYELAAGRQPFEGETASDVMSLILQKEPLPLTHSLPGVPAELERIVRKALRKDKEERYQTIKDLLIDLRNLRKELELEAEMERTSRPATARATNSSQSAPVTAHYPSSAEYIVEGLKQHKRVAIGALALVLTVSAVAAFFYFYRTQALTEKDTLLLADMVNTTGDPVFDGTLKQALAVQLGQSPFLNLFPEDRVRETLRYMGRSPDERVTKEVAREICQRQGIKALLTGSIASLGSHYVITLEALNSQTGEAIAREQVEAESKEQVLKTLGGAATKLREKLGESLASIQKFDAPVEQATTSSLEALKAFTLGSEMNSAGKHFEAIPFFKRAVELDSNFALAYLRLGIAHLNIGEGQLGAEYVESAFALRGRTSEREKFYISFYAFRDEIDKSIEVLELWKQTYPRDTTARTNLSRQHSVTGQWEKAVEEAGEVLRLDPNRAITYSNLGGYFLSLNRFDEARAILEQGVEKKLDHLNLRINSYTLAFVQGDEATMQRQVDWANGKPGEGVLHYMQARAAAFSGQRRKSQDLFRRSAETNERYGMKENAAWGQANYALVNAAFGDCRQTKESAANALNIARSKHALMLSGVALALCGETSRAQSLAGELANRNPKDTVVNTIWLPTIQAALEINRGNKEQAIQLLQVARRFEMGGEASAMPAYVRGLAYLRGGAGVEATAEFQKIIDHRGVVAVSALYPLAHLGLARAAALTGDTAKSRKAYEDFFALWKDADPDLPILIEAKKEYQKLR